MIRNIALAAAAVLAAGGVAAAQDGTPARPDFGTTMTLGGKGTAAQAAAADDTEPTWCCRRWGCGWGGCWGGGCGWGWGGCGWRSWGGCGWGVSTVSFAPVWSAPVNWGWGWPAPVPFSGGFGISSFSYARPRFGGGFYMGVNGTESDTAAPAVSLNLAVANNPLAAKPSNLSGGPFRYDGGPANPVPLPKPDGVPNTKTAPAATGLPVSLPKTPAKSPYTYKAYGEK